LNPCRPGPTIIEDNCLYRARSEVVEGCTLREGGTLFCGHGAFISGHSTQILRTAKTGEVFYGEVPAGSVVCGRSMRSKRNVCHLYAPSSYKRVDEKNTLENLDQRSFCRRLREPFHRSVSSLSETRFMEKFGNDEFGCASASNYRGWSGRRGSRKKVMKSIMGLIMKTLFWGSLARLVANFPAGCHRRRRPLGRLDRSTGCRIIGACC